GGALGLMLASWLVRLLAATPDLLPLPIGDTGPALDPAVLGFTMLLSLITGVVFGLAPALQASRTDVIGAIKQEAMPAGEGRGWLRKSLVAAQVALSIVSLVGAGWFLRSLGATVEIAPGFATDTVAIATVNIGREGYDRDRGLTFYDQVIERARAIPGAVSAAFAENVPLAGVQINRSMFLETEDTTSRDLRLVPVNYVSPGYFETTAIPLVAGRDFDRRDSVNAPPVAIINETMAKQFWPDRSPIGQRFRFFGEDTGTEVIGVARDSKVTGLAEEPAPLIYEPLYQDYRSFGSLIVRFTQPPTSASASLRKVIADLDSGLSVLDVRTLDQQVEASLTGQRSLTGLIGIFGTIALLLAASGIYGVASFWVGLRTREIGVRMALGARPAGMLALVLRQSMTVVLAGLLIGLALTGFIAIFLGSQVSTLLVGVRPTDPGTFVATVLVLFLVALLACAWPARRASRIDPLIALRQD
ncbi:MAG TPA: FtsX-like permease family protein, partial [Vicinamibacterales bacterium]|nr:FtsX-like permease family protein [Vicinamibacterales bacterium]